MRNFLASQRSTKVGTLPIVELRITHYALRITFSIRLARAALQRQQYLVLIHRQRKYAHAAGVVDGVGDGGRGGNAGEFADALRAVRPGSR